MCNIHLQEPASVYVQKAVGVGGTLWGFCPFFLSWVKPSPLSAELEFFQQTKWVSAAGSRGLRQSVCFLQPLQQSPAGTAFASLLSLSIPGQRKGLGGLLPIPTADCGCSNLYRLTVAFHSTLCHHWPHLQNNQGTGGWQEFVWRQLWLLHGIGLGLWHCHMLNSPLTTAVCVTLCNLQCFVL